MKAAGVAKPVAVRPQAHTTPARSATRPQASAVTPLIQRKCACGGAPGADGECEQCRKKRLGAQTKLRVSQPGDRFEREADRLAAQVVAGRPAGAISGVGAGGVPQRCAGGASGAAESEVLPPAGGGRPLDPATLASMQASLGHDFSRVRIHDGPRAAASARALNARAYTVGERVVFGAGQLDTASDAGRTLLAHELVHVAQQAAAPRLGASTRLVTAAPAAVIQRAPAAPATGGSSAPAGAPANASQAVVSACGGRRQLGVEDAVNAAQRRAKIVAERLRSFRRPKVRRAFRAIFGDSSTAARAVVLETLERVGSFSIFRSAAAASGSGLFLACASGTHPRCEAGAPATYLPPAGGAPATLLTCPSLVENAAGQLLDVETDSGPALGREAIVLHEMIHAARNSGGLDIYTGTRLQPLLRDLASPSGAGSAATVNPDSIVRFVYRSLATHTGLGAEAVRRSTLNEVFVGDREDTFKGFAGRRGERRETRLAVALADQWLQLGSGDLGVLEAELLAINPGTDTWKAISEEVRRTAGLLAGGEIAGGALTCPAGGGKVAIGCPDPQVKVAQQEITAVEQAAGHVRGALRPFRELDDGGGLATDYPGARLGSVAAEGPEPEQVRAIAVRRDESSGAQFRSGVETDAGKTPDVLSVGSQQPSGSNLGARARQIVEAVLQGVGAGADSIPLADFLERNGGRDDRDSTASLGKLAAQP
jgi:hypothetical protein